eukprot:SAG31_NODE_799_length_12017_cov_5.478436_5_plen_130_part_00
MENLPVQTITMGCRLTPTIVVSTAQVDTDSPAYFANVSRVLSEHGYMVIDEAGLADYASVMDATAEPHDISSLTTRPTSPVVASLVNAISGRCVPKVSATHIPYMASSKTDTNSENLLIAYRCVPCSDV